MTIDSKLAHLLSDFCLDVAKANFIATFIIPSFGHIDNGPGLIAILTRGTILVTLFLAFSWGFAKSEI